MKYANTVLLLLVLTVPLLWGAEPVPVSNAIGQTTDQVKGPDTTDMDSLHVQANALLLLTRQGGEDAVATIVPFLSDERLNTHACTALMNLPGNQGREALRAGLNTLSGPCLAGVICSLGMLKDEASRDKFSELAESQDALIADEARAALTALDRVPVLSSELASVPEEEALVCPKEDRDQLLHRSFQSDEDVALLQLWSQTVSPSADQVTALLDAYFASSGEAAAAIRNALELLCRRTLEPKEVTSRLLTQAKTASGDDQIFYAKLLALVGTKEAAEALGTMSFSKEDSVIDTATRLLGEWITLDAAPVLMDLAARHPDRKYRVRAVRGFIRLARQMEDRPDQRLAMADAITPLVERDEERVLLDELRAQTETRRTDQLLFDGQTFNGWEGDTENIFHIEDGAILAGSLETGTPRNEFLCTTKAFRDFTLTLECKVTGEGGNAGIQIRSSRVPNDSEMIGYQADMTADGVYCGRLYDESRRQKFLAESDEELIQKTWKPNDWNRYKIVCWGPRIKLFVNDVLITDYTETDPTIPLDGVIGLQIHGGGPSQASYRNIRIESYTLNIAE